MDSEFKVGQCSCCPEVGRLALIPVRIVEINLIALVKSITPTTVTVEYLLCGSCAAKVATGTLTVTRDGQFMENGQSYSNALEKKRKQSYRLQ